MSTALSVGTIVNGSPDTYNLTTFAVDPIANLVAADVDGNTFRNPQDRRTFALVKNQSGTHGIGVVFTAAGGARAGPYFGGAAGQPIPLGAVGMIPAPPFRAGWSGGLLADGEAKLYPCGPDIIVGGGDTIANYYRDTDKVRDATGISIAVFYLPRVDELAQAADDGPEGDYPEPVAADALVLPVQSITIDGLSPTFTDHDGTETGFSCAVRNDGRFTQGTRRLLWVRNHSGSNSIQLIPAGTDRYITGGEILGENGGVLRWFPSTSTEASIQGRWGVWVIDDGEEFLLGPFDQRFWSSGGMLFGLDMTDAMSWRAISSGSSPTYTPGTTSGLDGAWLELPV